MFLILKSYILGILIKVWVFFARQFDDCESTNVNNIFYTKTFYAI